MRRALTAYLAALWRGRTHTVAVTRAAEALADEP